MENIDCKHLLAVEAVYQTLRLALVERRVILSRGEFLASYYHVTVTVDGLLALALAGQSLRIDYHATPPSTGNGPRRRG